MPELAGRLYVPKLYKVDAERRQVVTFLETSVKASGGRVVYSSFRDQQVAPIYLGAEDGEGRRYGMLVYPFTTTKRSTRNRPADEHRAQIRFGDPVRARGEQNVIARDVAGVDVTLVLAVDPERGFIVGLDPLVYDDLPMGISVYYRDRHVAAAAEHGWAVWERAKKGGTRRRSWEGLETLVGFQPNRLLDYVRFEAKATGFEVELTDGRRFLVECKTASQKRYRNGDFKVEAQKTRDSGAGRKYTFDQFDVLAACLFSATGVWEFRFRWTEDLAPWTEDRSRIAAIQRIDGTWPASLSALADLVGSSTTPPA